MSPRASLVRAAAATVAILATAVLSGVPPAAAGLPAEVRGQVIDLDRRPLSGVEVVIAGGNGRSTTVLTGTDGRFATHVDSLDSVAFRDSARRHVLCRDDDQTRTVPGELEEYPFLKQDLSPGDYGLVQMCRPATVTGRVLHPDGRPIFFRDVHATNLRVQTDEDGRFVIPGLLPRRYHSFTVSPDGDEDDFITTRLTSSAFTYLKDGQQLDLGTVTTRRRDQVLGSIELTGDWARSPSLIPVTPRQVVSPDPEGLPSDLPGGGVIAGRYLLALDEHIWFGGRSVRSARPIEIRAGRVTRLGGPELDRAQTWIHVVDHEGRAVEGLFATIRRRDDPVEVIATLVIHGHQTINGVPRTRYRVTISDPLGRYATRTVDAEQTVDVGRPRRAVTFTAGTGTFRPFVLVRGGAPGTGADGVVTVFDAETGRPVRSGYTGHPIYGVPDGRYKLRFTDPTGRLTSAWIGGGSSFASAPAFWTAVRSPTYVPPLTVTPAFSPILLPRIVNVVRKGRSIAVTRGTWDGGPTRFDYRWFRDGKAIKGAKRSRYKVTSADVGHRITARVVARRAGVAKSMTTQPKVATR
ncbi:MAG: carboxypeptidase-like regulatory domain-containing protein [Aeromicrobium erythreum]